MRKNLLFTIALGAMAGIAVAAPLTPQEALLRAVDGQTAVGQMRRSAPAAQPQFVAVINDAEGNPAIYHYTYSGTEGFMLLPADDAVTPVLGYSETNRFAPLSELSPSMQSWLDYYAGQISDARTLGLPKYKAPATRAGEKAAIGPLLTTSWNQTAPYNNMCPAVGGRNSVTGCVATAMAQVMKYWEYPTQGQGSINYTTSAGNLSMDFSATTFDWANMRDSYGGSYSATAARAVATLMKACGYSVQMDYSPWESGAYSKDIPSALIKYFGYDQGVRKQDRSAISSQSAWDDLVYDELLKTGPVIYDGRSSSGGHCFVCDGYDGNGLFHINWGWGGLSDGYFELNELTPGEIGTGGHYGGYNINQDVILGIMPPVGRVTLEKIAIDNAASDTGNDKAWGYTYRIKDPNNILLSTSLKISGGHVSAPLYYTVHNTDTQTKNKLELELEGTFDERLNAGEGSTKCSTVIRMPNFDAGKLYTVTVSYDLKGTRTALGTLRFAASSGVGDIIVAGGEPLVWQLYDTGGLKVAETVGERPSLENVALSRGIYIAKAVTEDGRVHTEKIVKR